MGETHNTWVGAGRYSVGGWVFWSQGWGGVGNNRIPWPWAISGFSNGEIQVIIKKI
jgi:hypothetical protein